MPAWYQGTPSKHNTIIHISHETGIMCNKAHPQLSSEICQKENDTTLGDGWVLKVVCVLYEKKANANRAELEIFQKLKTGRQFKIRGTS